VRGFLAGLCLVAAMKLTACTFVVQPEGGSLPDARASTTPATQTAFILPDGTACDFAGTGATLAFEGKRLNYTCDGAPEGKQLGLLGDPVQIGETEWQVELATIGRNAGGFILEASELVEFTAWRISLSGGARCLHSGFGATLAFDAGRANYACTQIAADAAGPANGGEWVLLGRLVDGGAGTWLARRAEIIQASSGFAVVDEAEIAVSMVDGAEIPMMDGEEDASLSALTAVTWEWVRTEYSDDSVVEATDPSRYTLTFNADGSLNAQVDCNRGMGSYEVDGASLVLGPMATTRMMCPGDSQDSEFLKNLDGVVSYLIEDGMLYLALRYDTGIMVFQPGE
jgi:heat shock protein HslJ